MVKYNKIAFLFPGQGAQYPGMGKDFVENFAEARRVLEEADDILSCKLSDLILKGPLDLLTETRNSQPAIYVISIALLKVVQKMFPHLVPKVCAGLSLGEYTALTASARLDFKEGLRLVHYRGQFMNEACEKTQGSMAVILGLDAHVVEDMVKNVNMPQDLWAANFNCPGQVVISGTLKGIEKGIAAAKDKGAKRALPLQVHGAFHSGLMKEAELKLTEYILEAPLRDSSIDLVMNVNGDFVKDNEQVRRNLIKQVTHSVRWEQSVRKMTDSGVDLFVEIGCGKILSGFNQKIRTPAFTISIEKISDLDKLYKELL
jgi:[acyl-carrier-protein] S-malonyltransferase